MVGMVDLASKIRIVTPEIQSLVNLEFAKAPNDPEPGSPLDQVNLRGGDRVVYEYLEHGEFGLAVDHLNYMVEETDIELPPATRKALAEIAALMS